MPDASELRSSAKAACALTPECLQPQQKHFHTSAGKGNPCPLPLRAGQRFLSPSQVASIPSAVRSSCDFVPHVSTSQLGFFLGTSSGVDVAFQAVGSVEVPIPGRVCLATLFCLSHELCSGESRPEPTSFLHFIRLAARDPRSNLLINLQISHVFSLASCHLQFDRWVGGSPVRTEPLKGSRRVVWVPMGS